jgi:hypothetical protein
VYQINNRSLHYCLSGICYGIAVGGEMLIVDHHNQANKIKTKLDLNYNIASYGFAQSQSQLTLHSYHILSWIRQESSEKQ